jgi:hypothetical protein
MRHSPLVNGPRGKHKFVLVLMFFSCTASLSLLLSWCGSSSESFVSMGKSADASRVKVATAMDSGLGHRTAERELHAEHLF